MVMGVTAPNLPMLVQSYIKGCNGCLQYNLFFTAKSPFSKAIREQSGPDDTLDSCLNHNPLSFLVLDETGPVFYANPDDRSCNKYLTAHFLIGIEMVTSRVNIVVINDMSILSVVQGLEILQNVRGNLLNLIFDAHKSHLALTRQSDKDTRADIFKLIQGNSAVL